MTFFCDALSSPSPVRFFCLSDTTLSPDALICSCQVMPSMRLRHRRWKLLKLFSCFAYIVHALPPQIRVLKTQACYTQTLVFSVSVIMHERASSLRAMSGDVGNHDPPHNSVICSCQQLYVIGWSFKSYV